MRSDRIKKGFERAPHRALLKATGVADADMGKPFIAVCNSYIDIIPGHVHLRRVAAVVKDAIREAGGVPFEFNTIGVDDVSPEAAAGGPLALVHEGDAIKIDLAARRIDLEVAEEELQKRRETLPEFEIAASSRWLKRYAKWVTSASTGAVFAD